MRKTRVLFLIDSLRVGGKERQLVEMLRGLKNNKSCNMLVVNLGREDFYLGGFEKLNIKIKYMIRIFKWDPLIFPRLLYQVLEYKPHLIFTNGMLPSFYGVPVARLLRIPVINNSIRNAFTHGGFKWKLELFLLNLSNYRLANSNAGLISRGFTESSRNVVIHNGFDSARLKNISGFDKKEIQAENKLIIGMVAEFSPYKDFPTFIRAAQSLLTLRDDLVFVMVGHGETLDACRRMVSPEETAIHFLGAKKDVESIIATMDIGVLATYTEGISNTIMEYMALKKPVIATDGGGTSEIVSEGVTGLLVPPKNPRALREKIEYLVQRPDMRLKMGEAGYNRLKQKFSFDDLTRSTWDLFCLAVKSGEK